MSLEELKRYKNMPIENIDRKIVPDIEDIKDKKNIAPLSMYFMKVGNVVVKCSYAGNGRHLEDCLLSYLKKKAMLLDFCMCIENNEDNRYHSKEGMKNVSNT